MALPGVSTILRDRKYNLSRTDIPVGPRVLVIGTRDTASGTGGVVDYDPYRATDEQVVVTNFGSGSALHRAYVELTAAGAASIYQVAIPQGTDDTTLQLTTSNNPLDTAMAAAESAQPDIIVLYGRGGHPSEWAQPATPNAVPQVGFFADNGVTAATSTAKRFADWCATITGRSHPVLGVVGLAPYVNTSNATASMTAAQTATHINFTNLVNRADNGFGANGPYISVVGTELIPTGYQDAFGYANGACAYAGAISQLSSFSSPTGKVLFNIAGVRFNPTMTQQQSLINLGIVPVALNFSRIPVWVDSKTFGTDVSDYTRLTTMRIVFDAVLMVRTVAQSFIGEAATLQNRNALETAITSGLRSMQQAGALISSDFVVTYIPAQNQANVDLVLTPAFEMRNIQVTVSVNLG